MKKSASQLVIPSIIALLLFPIHSIAKEPLQYSKATTIQSVSSTVNHLNVRTGPGIAFPVIKQLTLNEQVSVLSSFQSWYVVELKDHSIGVISKKFAKQITPTNSKQPKEKIAPKEVVPTFKVPDPKSTSMELSQKEEEMFSLINQERTLADLPPITMDPLMLQAARLKAEDMSQKGYFEHISPTYGSPFSMLKQMGLSYRAAGENIVGNHTIFQAHQALMHSANHKANILKQSYNSIGIGIVPDDHYGYICVQLFANKE